MDWQKIALGALLGAVGALTADTHSASQSWDPWDWRIALKRASAGAMIGAAAAAGLNQAAQ